VVVCLGRWLEPDVRPPFATTAAGRGGFDLCVIALIAAGVLVRPFAVQAQADDTSQQAGSALRAVVLRQTQGELTELAGAIDGAVLRDLGDLAGIERPAISPIDYAEIQLTVGCSDEGRSCLVAIAQMLEVDAVVVRRLALDGQRVVLTLVYFDARSAGEPAHSDRIAERGEADHVLPQAVPSLVRALFGIPDPGVEVGAPAPATSSSEPTEPSSGALRVEPAVARSGPARIGVLTWVALATGTAVLGAGLAVGASASADYERFKALPVRSAMDAARANERFDRVETKAVVANVLMPTGAALMALGGVMLVLNLNHGEQPAMVALQPLRGGALLTLRAIGGAF
jgi:hypothetical protein